MKILLDTNIVIHRETGKIVRQDIGQLFFWLDKLRHEKYIHPISIIEIEKYKDEQVLKTIRVKLESYNLIKHPAKFGTSINQLSGNVDKNQNDVYDTQLLNEVYEGRVDCLISEDKKIHLKAAQLGISKQVFKIQTFLEKATAENPDLVNYKILAVKKIDFAEVDINDPFFDSFRLDYAEFNKWFNKKSEDPCYVCYQDDKLIAFLFIKIEDENENHSEITPSFPKKKRLKIGTLKVTGNGYKIGERFLKTVFDNASQYKVHEIYVTIFNKRPEQEQLIDLLQEWGFKKYGIKTTPNGEEFVYTRTYGKSLPVNIQFPKLTYPFISRKTNKYIIKIEPQYHTELFPDSINTKEDSSKYTENEPHRNRISKVYISHSKDRNLKAGDIIVIYRMGETTPKKYSSTVTTICIVESIRNDFKNFEEFYDACNRRTMIARQALLDDWWNKFPGNRPFVVNFLYAHSFPTPKPTLNDLNVIGVIPDIMNMPRGFIPLDNDQFNTLLKFAYKKKQS
ncbi:MAG: hypothetical protein EOO50_00630 [Flavobacterium sp.]|uniref:PIN domain-containing protein n=1 Tax=Flavobacterium sp. TaxID=239 RepID=UPI0012172D93|nr:PIN domain-containing protein [Flavobacterium sp.]RZJ68716.1 MAG: hypothetical protein EOO50_00630 [Flavobacterium sp.]